MNFEKEATQTKFRETNKDLSAYNPNLFNPEPEVDNFAELRARVIDLCRRRSGNGLRGLRIMFRAMDRNKNKSLDPTEFKYAMRDYGVPISDLEVS